MLVKQKGIASGLNRRAKLSKQEGSKELLNIDNVVVSALEYLTHLEKVFKNVDVDKPEVYGLIKRNLESGQSAEATKLISGRIFGTTTYYMKADDKHERMTGEITDTKLGSNFLSTELIIKLKIMMQGLDRKQIEPFLNDLAASIDNNPQWQAFWRERSEEANQVVAIGKQGNPSLKDMMLGILMYKTIGECENLAISSMAKASPETAMKRKQFMSAVKESTKGTKGTFIPTPLEVQVQPPKVETVVEKPSQLKASKAQENKPVTHTFSSPPKNVQDKVKFFEKKIKEQEEKTPKGKPNPNTRRS